MIDRMVVLSNLLLAVVTTAVLIEQGLMDSTLTKLQVLLSGGRLRKAVTYTAKHSHGAMKRCIECAREFASKLGRHERPKHEAP